MKPACARLQALKVLIASAIFLSLVGVAYPQVPQITRPVNDSVTVSLKGDVHPQAKARFDRGAVSDSQPMGTMMVTLKRPAEREAALQQFMVDVHKQGTATYHKWLTPAQYAQNFGPADSDIASVQTWLESQGFAVQKVSAGKTAIVFSGTAGQVRRAFHTQVHSYFVGGTNHYANSTAPMIPAGLSPVIAGVGPFHDFSPRSLSRVLGKATWDPQTHRVTPSWTVPTQNGNFYLVGPQDLATQYNLNPLYAAGITGAGQTIGIVNVSNIDLSVVAAYRKLFNLDGNSAPNLPQVVVDGADPGIGLAATEAYLDVEVSGALAPKATVKLYTSNNLLSAAIRAVDDDEATVLSVSFGTCEPELGPSGNAFINALWQQAAAQGQTVMVATGDSGAAGCSGSGFGVDFYGLQVNGFASTPWNVGVGGTDFYYKDYASGGASITKYWDATNGLGQRSMKSPIPEQPWNQSPYGKNIRLPSETIEGVIINEVAGGGGGQSQCAVPGNGNDPMVDPNGVRYCTGLGGYPKPAWQSGPGVPKDSVRDLPDVALFAAAGTNDSTYAICVSLGDCVAKDPSNGIATFVGVGGTSASTPAFAGIMALVNQKYGAQGQANNVLYSLAANHSSVFHDIAVGSINEPCYNVNAPIAVLLGGANSGIPADPECLLDANSTTLYSLQKWPATVGYDLATGLGSVDANALVAHWNTLSYSPTATVLAATPASITHGQNVTLSASVSGAGVPTGSVAIISDLNLPASKGLLAIPLDDTGAGAVTVQSLPGGRYTLFGRYGGDTSFASSESPPISITVSPEASVLNVMTAQTSTFDPNGLDSFGPIVNGATYTYGTGFLFDAQPTGAGVKAGQTEGAATGVVTFRDFQQVIGVVPLDATGNANINSGLSIGSHSITASYSGDKSFKPSRLSQPITFTITPEQPGQSLILPEMAEDADQLYAGDDLWLLYIAQTPLGASAAVTGTVTFNLDSTHAQTVNIIPHTSQFGQIGLATAVFHNVAAGTYIPSGTYNGNATYPAAATVNGFQIRVLPANGALASSTDLAITSPANPNKIANATPITFTATVRGPPGATVAPTGTISLVSSLFEASGALVPGANGKSTATITVPAYQFGTEMEAVLAAYSGDSVYRKSDSNPIQFNTPNAGDFSMITTTPNVTVESGESGSAKVQLSSVYLFSGNVRLTCTVTGKGKTLPQCRLPSTVAVPASSSDSVTARVGLEAFAGGKCDDTEEVTVLKGGQDGRCGRRATPVPAGTYNVVVSATNGASIHNVVITMVVRSQP